MVRYLLSFQNFFVYYSSVAIINVLFHCLTIHSLLLRFLGSLFSLEKVFDMSSPVDSYQVWEAGFISITTKVTVTLLLPECSGGLPFQRCLVPSTL